MNSKTKPKLKKSAGGRKDNHCLCRFQVLFLAKKVWVCAILDLKTGRKAWNSLFAALNKQLNKKKPLLVSCWLSLKVKTPQTLPDNKRVGSQNCGKQFSINLPRNFLQILKIVTKCYRQKHPSLVFW